MSVDASGIKPFIGCTNVKGANFSDCKRGMVINRTLKQGDELIKLRELLNFTDPNSTPNNLNMIMNNEQ